MDYKIKYLKYKSKYLELKKQYGGVKLLNINTDTNSLNIKLDDNEKLIVINDISKMPSKYLFKFDNIDIHGTKLIDDKNAIIKFMTKKSYDKYISQTESIPLIDFITFCNTIYQGLHPYLRKAKVFDHKYRSEEAKSWRCYSAVENTNIVQRILLKKYRNHDIKLDSAVGSLIGMAIGDAVGAHLEFIDVINGDIKIYGKSYFDRIKMEYYYPENRFELKLGQWTDDASMGFCIADSIISNGGNFDGSDCRARFHTWWYFGYCNAFCKEETIRGSVGLGGNISKSINDCNIGIDPDSVFNSSGEDAGNGSLMRLSPIAIAFHNNIELAREIAKKSSYTTHPGPLAAECCAFLVHLIIRAIYYPIITDGKLFLEEISLEYIGIIDKHLLTITSGSNIYIALEKLRRLLLSSEPITSTELCWNWKHTSLNIFRTIENRGKIYNGYPVISSYFGSFCMDGLSMALWSIYHTKSFDEAIEQCVNLLGDADSTGSITGQIAGAIYGTSTINPIFIENLEKWDDGKTEIRADMLYYLGVIRR